MAITVNNLGEYSATIELLKTLGDAKTDQLVNIINTYNLSPEQFRDFASGAISADVEPWYTQFDKIGGYRTITRAPINPQTGSIANAINSNAGETTQVLVKTPIETSLDQAGNIQVSRGLTSVATGAKSGLTFVAKEVLPAVSAAGLGIRLGKAIDSALYNANPDFWDNIGMSELNPDTWGSITADYPDGFLKSAFNTIFGIDTNTGQAQMYLDARAAAYLASYMQSMGVFNAGGYETTEGDAWSKTQWWYNQISFPIPSATGGGYIALSSGYEVTFTSGVSLAHVSSNMYWLLAACETPIYSIDSTGVTRTWGNQINVNGKQFYRAYFALGSINSYTPKSPIYQTDASLSAYGDYIAYLLLYGNTESQEAVPGISDQEGATQPDFSGCTTLQDYMDALEEQFPDMFNDAVSQKYVDPETGEEDEIIFLPIGTPTNFVSDEDGNPQGDKPITDPDVPGQSQDEPAADPDNYNPDPDNPDLPSLEDLLQMLIDMIVDIIPSGYDDDEPEPGPQPQPQPQPNPDNKPDPNPAEPANPDPTGSGDSPAVITPSGSASALWSVYNPTQAQVNSFGAWLWSSNFIDQLLKLFNNPMQSIIGIHKIFATPQISGSGNIVVGYLDSGVQSNIVGNQYTDIDCGSIMLAEQFGNVFDYTDTTVKLYLPFIGIVQLDTSDVMRGTISVIYHVDVITGACLADVNVTRDAAGGTLYQFSGDAAVRYPISSGSYMGIVAGIASVVGGIASAAMTGGAALPMAAGAIVGGAANSKTQVQHSGSFAGNAGAMGAKIPYLIIERPQTMIAQGYNKYEGIGSNQVVAVGDMAGYFKLAKAKVTNVIGASEAELVEIKSYLENGVMI